MGDYEEIGLYFPVAYLFSPLFFQRCLFVCLLMLFVFDLGTTAIA